MISALLSAATGWAGVSVYGFVRDAETEEALPGVAVTLDGGALWAVSGADGRYELKNVPKGEYLLEAGLIGYESFRQVIRVGEEAACRRDIRLRVSSLALDEVVVTAEAAKENINTTRTIGRTALDHLQMSGVSNVAALLPGGKTVNPDLTTESPLSLRGGGVTAGNAAFATAIEVNGVRMGDNASFGDPGGVDTRSLPVENIESVEVLTGVPSAEYGDLGSGMVRVITKKGRTPLSITTSVNPRTYDVSLAKGVELSRGVLNISGQWTRATKKLVSPYTSYTRRGFTAEYSATFADIFHVEAGITGNVGGMDSKDDPDSFSEQRTVASDNILTPHVKAQLLLNRDWVTNVSLEASVYYHDQKTREHLYNSSASSLPAVHAAQEGYFLATALPPTYYADRVTDSRELDYSASLKYDWLRHFGPVKSSLKAGLQWKADGNVGEGEYYEDPALSANGYRPRPYKDYPYMHTLSAFVEDKLTLPLGRTRLDASLGLRAETVLLKGAHYDHLRTLSPRINLRWHFSDALALRGGWGLARKLPSFFVLYPKQEYLDIRTFSFSYGNEAGYVYYTRPYHLVDNPDLRWQTHANSEIGIDYEKGGWKLSLAGFCNLTLDPYESANAYAPFSYRTFSVPDGFTASLNPDARVDAQTGEVFLRDEDGYYQMMQEGVTDRSFVNEQTRRGGATVRRTGLEMTADFPEIRPVKTHFRLDASYTCTIYHDTRESYYYNTGWPYLNHPNRSYPYVGIYEGPASVIQGRRTDYLDANLTAITHIPMARLIVTLRVEAALLRRSQNRSDRAFTVTSDSLDPTGGDIYDGHSYTAVCPVAWMDLDGVRHDWTAADAADPDLRRLILRSTNAYTFATDGYDPYMSANLSLTKEIGRHVSLSFFANNFTAARPWRESYATGVSAIFTPAFYYGLTCRIKL